MKLSTRTVEILKNCAANCASILIKEGNTVRSISQAGEVIIDAAIEETFPNQFSIAELNRLLGALSLYDSPEVGFKEDYLTIGNGTSVIKYRYSSDMAVNAAPYDDLSEMLEIDFDNPLFEFNITEEQMSKLMKAAAVMELSDICIKAKDGQLTMSAMRRKDRDHTDSYDIELGDCNASAMIYLSRNNLKLLPTDYTVQVFDDLIRFYAGSDLSYYISHDSGSTVN